MTIVSKIEKPGGTIPNPVEARRADTPTIPNPGISVGFMMVTYLEYLRFYVHHCVRIQRDLVATDMTVTRLMNVYGLKEREDRLQKETMELPVKILKVDDIRNKIEDLDNYLMRKRGMSGLPLAYVVREKVELPVDDPGFGLPNPTIEMVERGSHTQPAFDSDSIEVFDVIRHMTHGGLAWSWVSAYDRNKDGRNAYIALKNHYLGESYQARIKAAADAVLSKTYYDGQRSFAFEQYLSVLQKAFTDLESTGEAVAEEKKIRILLNGITASSLQMAVTAVRASRRLKVNYELAVNFLAETHDSITQAGGNRRNISSVASAKGKNDGTPMKNFKKKGNSNSSHRYYKKSEWWALTDAQRAEIQKSRRHAITKMKQSVKQLVTGVAKEDNTAATETAPTQAVGALMTRRVTNS
jgi:hypothetical protein